MNRCGHRPRSFLLALLALFGSLPAAAQQRPLSLQGQVSTGYSSSHNSVLGQPDFSTFPFALKFDLSGYWGHPDFFSFRVRPQVGFGKQIESFGVDTDDGVSAELSFLRRRAIPLTVTFKSLHRDTFRTDYNAPLTLQPASYLDQEFGLRTGFHRRGLPQIGVDYNQSNLSPSESGPLALALGSRTRRFAINVQDQRWGWTTQGTLQWTRFSTDLVSFSQDPTVRSRSEQTYNGLTVTSQRPLWRGNSIAVRAGKRDGRFEANQTSRPLDTWFAGVGLSLRRGDRLTGRLGYDYANSTAGSLQRPIAGTETFLLRQGSSTTSLSGEVRYQASDHLTLLGDVDQRNFSLSDSFSNLDLRSVRAARSRAGLLYQREMGKIAWSGSYSFGVGRRTDDLSQTSLLSHDFSVEARSGSLEKLEWTALLTWNRSQSGKDIPFEGTGRSFDFSVGRNVGAMTFRAGFAANHQESLDGSELFSNGLRWNASVSHRLFSVSYGRGSFDSDFLPLLVFDQNTTPPSTGEPQDILLARILTTSSQESLTLRLNPWSRFQMIGFWQRNHATTTDGTDNKFANLYLALRYRFRLLDFEAGYRSYEQANAPGLAQRRTRFFFRVIRPFVIF